eukprot:RCo032329
MDGLPEDTLRCIFQFFRGHQLCLVGARWSRLTHLTSTSAEFELQGREEPCRVALLATLPHFGSLHTLMLRLPEGKVSAAVCQGLGHLSSLPSLTSLVLDRRKYRRGCLLQGSLALGSEVMKACLGPRLSTIELLLPMCGLTDVEARALSRYLQEAPGLTSLAVNARHNNFSGEGLRLLLRSVDNPRLTHLRLNLAACYGPDCVSGVSRAPPFERLSPRLEFLALDFSGLGRTDIVGLVGALCPLTGLKTLKLSLAHCKIGDLGLAAAGDGFANILSRMTQLVVLDIDMESNDLRDHGLPAFVLAASPHFPSEVVLRLDCNYALGDTALEGLAVGVQRCELLDELRLELRD